MKKKAFARIPNWAVGAAITLLFLLSFTMKGTIGFLDGIELKTYDLRMQLSTPLIEANRIAIVAIDSESISKLGRWPWPRDRIAAVIDKLSGHGAKVIGLNILFTEPEESTGLGAVRNMRAEFSPLKISSSREGRSFLSKLDEMEDDLDNDIKLETSLSGAGNVILPYVFNTSGDFFGTPPEVPPFVSESMLNVIAPPPDENFFYPPFGASILHPIETLGNASAGFGHLNKFPGRFSDGIDRWESLAIEYDGQLYPSFALSVAASYMGYGSGNVNADLRPEVGGIVLGNHLIQIDEQMGMLINYYDTETSFPIYSFFDVYNDKVSPTAFKGKVVLLGITDVGLGDASPTPIAPLFSAVEREATIIENILTGATIMEPWWSAPMALGAIIFFGIVTTVLLSRLAAMTGAIISGVLFVVYVGAAFYLFRLQNIWVEMTHPALFLVVNYLALTSKKFWFTERAKLFAETEGDEANKLLGLTFQGKGMLEMAFEKFKTIPVNDEMKEVLYNLGLDFEKKRNWAQAISAYERVTDKDKKFKDVGERLGRLAGYTSGAGGPVNLKGDSATIISDGGELPTLGRYEVIRELGRGAMGVVYLGKDPKINRQVAIKTVNFDEMEEKMVPELKKRFFREAESAGTLNHPNILTIFDVGEEGNLAYIAMELIDGKDLDVWTTKEKLLPPKDALLVVTKVAEALDFAHTHGIIHRDIKPANIMVTKKHEIKVTDFGIARIQSASATKTGTVMGTPSYMSPEQVAGKKVDGRSDIFSLGVVLFELLTSERPFKGDSIATIMYNITNNPATPLKKYNPKLPGFCQQLIDKATAKDPAKRFQKAGEFAGAIRWCLKKHGSNL